MTFVSAIEGWMPLVGGLSGLAAIGYMIWMGYHAHKKTQEIVELRVQVAEVKGMLEGRRRR